MCLSSCGMLYKGKPLKDITCPCGLGYWDIFQERFVTGDQIREGAPPRREYEAKVKAKLKEGEFDSRLREQFIRHFFKCKKKLALDTEALRNGTGEPSSRQLAEAELKEIARGDFKSRGSTALTEYYLPAEGIRQDVLDHHCQDKNTFGSAATVQPGIRAGRQGYYIKTTKEITVALISELKRDSAMVEENMRQKAQLDQGAFVEIGRSGPGARPDLSSTRRDFEQIIYDVDDLARDTQGVRITSDQSGRIIDRSQDDRAKRTVIVSQQQATERSNRHYAEEPISELESPRELADALLYSTNSRQDANVERRDLKYRRESGDVLVARRDGRPEPRETRYLQRDGSRHQSERQQYPPRSVQTDLYDRHRQGDTSLPGRDVVLDTRGMTTDSYGRSPGSNRTAMSSTDQSGGQIKYTREDVEQLVAKKLKELGRQQVRAEEFRTMVDREFQKLNNELEQRSRVSPQAHQQGAYESSQATMSTFGRGAAAADPLLDYNHASQINARQEHRDTRTDTDTRRQATTQRPREGQSDVPDRRTNRRETRRDPRNTDDLEPEDSPPPRRHDSSRRSR